MAPILVPEIPSGPPSKYLHDTILSNPQSFLQPTRSLYDSSLTYLKSTLDPLAQSISTLHADRVQQSRHIANRNRKRKHGQDDNDNDNDDGTTIPMPVPRDPLKIKQVHVQGFDVEQVWEQVRRVLDAGRVETEMEIERLKSEIRDLSDDESVDHDEELGADMQDEPSDSEEEAGGLESSDEDEEALLDDIDEQEGDFDSADAVPDDQEDRDEDDQTYGSVTDSNDADHASGPRSEYDADPNGLNDGFFSLDEFNKRSAWLEQADGRGDPDNLDEEDEIDFTVDPLAQTGSSGRVSRKAASNSAKSGHKKHGDGDEDGDEDEDDGPTFGDADLDTPDSDEEDEDDDIEHQDMDLGDMDMANTNDIYYNDFFAPPAQKVGSKNKDRDSRAKPHKSSRVPKKGEAKAEMKSDKPDLVVDQDEDMDRTMSGVHRDLFEDESDLDEQSDNGDQMQEDDIEPGLKSGARGSAASTHQRRQAALAREIRQLEAANVARRDWTLSGEARATERPVNSLLEEDLDFERTGKPVTVVTAELSEDIEALIKRRILAFDFNDLIRRRPDDLATGSGGNATRRGLQRDFELDDTKNKKSLAELYEDDHLRATDANYLDATSEKTTKDETEILNLWKSLCSNLDSLTSWNFKPRQAVPTLDVRVDAPTISLEDARPSTGAAVASESGPSASQLAPQEIYRSGEAVERRLGETTTRGGVPLAREEMSRDDKKRRRRRAKERGAKNKVENGGGGPRGGKGDNAGEKDSTKTTKGTKRDEEREVLGQLKRGGVRVISRKGEVRDVDGNRVSSAGDASRATVRASALKQ